MSYKNNYNYKYTNKVNRREVINEMKYTFNDISLKVIIKICEQNNFIKKRIIYNLNNYLNKNSNNSETKSNFYKKKGKENSSSKKDKFFNQEETNSQLPNKVIKEKILQELSISVCEPNNDIKKELFDIKNTILDIKDLIKDLNSNLNKDTNNKNVEYYCLGVVKKN